MKEKEPVLKITEWIHSNLFKSPREYEAAILELLEVIKKNETLLITLLSSCSESLAKTVTLFKSYPLEGNPDLQTTTTYDDQRFIGYHTILTERLPGKIEILYSSAETYDYGIAVSQHRYARFYALHLFRNQLLYSQNQGIMDETRLSGALPTIQEGIEL